MQFLNFFFTGYKLCYGFKKKKLFGKVSKRKNVGVYVQFRIKRKYTQDYFWLIYLHF